MAYCPIEQGRLLRNRKLADVARRHGMTPAQAALAWLLSHDDVIAIPKTSNPQRLQENLGAAAAPLAPGLLAELDGLFPPPAGPVPLEMI
jgi:aldehyde reductase